MLITEFLKELRRKNNETLQDMARKIGCSAQFLFYVESGRSIPPPNWQEILEKIRKIFICLIVNLTEKNLWQIILILQLKVLNFHL